MFLSSYVSKKEVLHGYRGGGGHVFFAKYTLNLACIYPIFSSQKILFSSIILVKSGSTPCKRNIKYIIMLLFMNHCNDFAPLLDNTNSYYTNH